MKKEALEFDSMTNFGTAYLTARQDERREYLRVPLRCFVKLWRDGESETIDTKTENLSRNGFYASMPAPCMPGDILEGVVEIPAAVWGQPQFRDPVMIRCRVEAVRVDVSGADPVYGVAFRLLSSTVIASLQGASASIAQ